MGAVYGSQFTNSGFSLTANFPPGVYLLYIAAFSTVANGFNQAQHITVTVATSQPVIAIEQPAPSSTVAQPFGITGWAIDLGAPVQDGLPGVDRVHIHAIANGELGRGRSWARRARIIRDPMWAPSTGRGSPTAGMG